MSKILEIQKLACQILKHDEFLKKYNVFITNSCVDGDVYPFIKIGSCSKTIEDDFSEQIACNINVVSNQNNSIEVLNIANCVERCFKDNNLLKNQILKDQLYFVSSILSYRVIKTDFYQDESGLFNAIITINFIINTM